jgi:hypothetical protein
MFYIIYTKNKTVSWQMKEWYEGLSVKISEYLPISDEPLGYTLVTPDIQGTTTGALG